MRKKEEDFFAIREGRINTFPFVLLLVLVYVFALAVRYYWIQWAGGHPEFFWNGQVMINTNDGYFWAEGARDILAGGHQPNDLSPVTRPTSILTAFLAKILPVSFETLILWMPAAFGSLLIVPVALIGRALKLDRVGLFAALLAGIAWSYYNRTMAGYYDNDMLTIALPAFVLWGMIMAVLQKRNRYMALTAVLMLLYQWWYPQGGALDTSFVVMLLLYTLVFERRNLYNYKLMLFMLLSLLPLGWQIDLGLILAAFALFHFGGTRTDRAVFPLLLLTLGGYVALGGLAPIWYQIKGYLLRESLAGGGTDDLSLNFYAVNKTVRESGKIPFEIFANRISGHRVTFVLSLVGYLMMAVRYRLMWLALPMLGLGFLAMMGGLRFTVYAVPVMALGMAYLAFWFAERLAGTLTGDLRGQRLLGWGVAGLIAAGVLYPNIRHAIDYKVPTVFVKPEVEVLDRLKKIADREDYVLAWWDYGYPIRYYSDVKTLVDGGKHTGDVNYPVSFALTMPQTASANMARLDVEYTERNFRERRRGSYLSQMMKDYNETDPYRFLSLLDNPEMKLPVKTREIYYYLPLRMLNIFTTVAIFSMIDLNNGQPVGSPKLQQFRVFRNQPEVILFGRGIFFDKRNGTFVFGKKQVPIHSLVTAGLDRSGQIRSEELPLHPDSDLYLVYMKSHRRFLLMDKKMYNSTYIQLFVLGKYDPDLFEPVIVSPMASVYRLKK